MSATYELIKKLEQLDYFPQILTSGLIPMNWIDYSVIYEFYLKDLETILKGEPSNQKARRQSKANTAEEFNIGESSVYRIIKLMTN